MKVHSTGWPTIDNRMNVFKDMICQTPKNLELICILSNTR